MIYTHVLNRPGSRGVQSPADRMTTFTRTGPRNDMGPKPVRMESDTGSMDSAKVALAQAVEVESTKADGSGYCTKFVRLLDFF